YRANCDSARGCGASARLFLGFLRLLCLGESLVLPNHFERRAVGEQLALLDPQRTIARVLDRAHRVRDEEDGTGVLTDGTDTAFGTVTELLVTDVERLVDDEDLVLHRG